MFKLFDRIAEDFMRRQFKFGVCVAGGILLAPSVFFGALAQEGSHTSPRQILSEAVIFAEALRSNESINQEEYETLVCSAMQDAVTGGMSPAGAISVGGITGCGPSFIGGSAGGDGEPGGDNGESTGEIGTSGGDTGRSGGHAPATPIVIPSTTAGSNDSTSPTSN